MRVSPVASRQHRTIREQSVQSSALKARLQQKAARGFVNSKFTRLLSVFIRYIVPVFIPTPCPSPQGLPFKGIARGRLQEERDSW
jgi:hypothetical protein